MHLILIEMSCSAHHAPRIAGLGLQGWRTANLPTLRSSDGGLRMLTPMPFWPRALRRRCPLDETFHDGDDFLLRRALAWSPIAEPGTENVRPFIAPPRPNTRAASIDNRGMVARHDMTAISTAGS
jgi:hypothetical protein